jgi:hypothetical protein
MFLGIRGAYAQQQFQGTVIDDNTGKALEDVSIALLNNSQAATSFTYTDQQGHFSLTAKTPPSFISIALLGYKRQIIPINEYINGSIYKMHNEGYKIKEVKVVSHRIRKEKDTIIYSVAGFRMPQDRSIADVLKKMPGIEVTPAGQIKVQGQPISKLYIEGMDLMGSKYAMATDNLSGKVVKEVQILNHHQPIAALRGKTFSEQIAINLALTDNVHFTTSGTADLGIGYSDGDKTLWSGRLVALFLGKKQQNLSLYKTNNNGEDVSNEIQDQIVDEDMGVNEDAPILTLPDLSISQVDEKHYLDNKSHLFATNHLYKMSKNSTLRGQFTYQSLHNDMHEETISSYFYPDGTTVITENNKIASISNDYHAEADYQLNSSSKYIRNKLTAGIEQDKATNIVEANANFIEPVTQTKKKNITNAFQYINTYNKNHILKITSINSFQDIPQTLTVTPGLYEELLNQGNTYDGLTQDVRMQSFHSHTKAKLQLMIAKFYINMETGINYDYQKLTSSLFCRQGNERYPTSNLQFANDVHFSDANLFGNPSLTYKSDRWNILFSIPLSFHSYHLKSESKKDYFRFFPEPSLHMAYSINAYWDLNQTINYRYQTSDINQLYNNYIFSTYRNARRGSDFYNYRMLIYSIFLKFSNPLDGLFWSLSGSIVPNWQNKMLVMNQDNILTSSQMFDKKYTNLQWNIRSRLSKAFGWWKLFTALRGNYSENRNKNMLSGQMITFENRMLSLSFDYSLQPCKYISVEGKEGFSYSKLSSKITDGVSSSHTKNELTLNAFPSSNWKLKWRHQLLISHKPVHSSIYFMDTAVSYLYKQVEFEFSMNNILNKSYFQQIAYSSMMEESTLNYFRSREGLIKVMINF